MNIPTCCVVGTRAGLTKLYAIVERPVESDGGTGRIEQFSIIIKIEPDGKSFLF